MTRVKICGLRTAETAVEAAKAGADFVGIVFAESKRRVTPQECHDIVEAIGTLRRQEGPARFDGPARGEVRASSWFAAWNEALDDAIPRYRPLIAGVFAGQSLREVNDIAGAAKLDLVQLSGGEDDDFARGVVRPVLRVLHVGPGATADDLVDAATPGIAGGILLDTASTGIRGGSGEAFDWAVAAEVGERLPVMLAGGLTPENVAAAIAAARPWAVDVSSGVETAGAKDIEKIRAFIRAAKGAPVG